MKLPLILALTLLAFGLSPRAHAGDLRLTIHDVRSASGTMLIGLYDSAGSFNRAIERSDQEGFLNDPQRVAGLALRANADLMSEVVFCNLKPGRYAIIIFQDENSNGMLDKNPWGVPFEPYGFSNDAHGFLGPPSFADAAMLLGDGDHSVSITLVYHGARASSATSTDPFSSEQ